MKVGDLVRWKDKPHIVTKEYTHLYNLQEVGSDWPPSIMDKGLAKVYIKRGDLVIISKKV
jgi:hypothetical protein